MRFASATKTSATRDEKIDELNKAADSTETTSNTSETSRDSFCQDFNEEVVENMEDVMHRDLDPTDLNVRTTTCIECVDDEILQSAELWFAEARNCTCCNGFKHGCMACASWFGSFTCRCAITSTNGTGPPDDVSAITSYSTDRSHRNSPNRSTFASGKSRKSSSSRSRSGRSLRMNKNRGEKQPCRFFFSAGGCRYGGDCSYDHTKRQQQA